MRQLVTYSRQSLSYLVKKVLLIFCVAAHRRSPLILSGLLGGGAFRNNWPLVLRPWHFARGPLGGLVRPW
jgi:hypothetical protein